MEPAPVDRCSPAKRKARPDSSPGRALLGSRAEPGRADRGEEVVDLAAQPRPGQASLTLVLQRADTSPAALRAQAFGEIAAEQMLPEMHELAAEIDPDLPAQVAP